MTWFFIHIPKTGGTALREAMAARFGDSFRFVPRGGVGEAAAEPSPTPAMVYGHISFGAHRRFGLRPRYLTVVRHPVDRVVSLYYHHLREAQKPGKTSKLQEGIGTGEISLIDFVTGAGPGSSAPAHDDMTRLIGGRRHEGPAALESAKRRIEKHFGLVGLTERMPETVERIADLLGWNDVPTLSRANTNPLRPEDPPTTEEISVIEHHNQLDLALYDWVQDRFDAGV